MVQISDKALIKKYLQGDEKSLEILIRRYLKPIYNFVYRYVGNAPDAEDLTQEVFIKVWRNLKKFDQRKNFKVWLFSIAKNASLDFLKKKKVILFSELEKEGRENMVAERFANLSSLSPIELFEKTNLTEILSAALKKLPLSAQMLLFLHYHHHFTFQKIAKTFSEPLNTVKSKHRRAILRLRKILKAEKINI